MSPAPAPRPSRRRPLLVAIAAISVLILGVLVIGRVDRADVAVQVEGSVAVDPTTAPSTSAPASSTSTAAPDTIDDPAPVAVDPAPDAARMVDGLQQFVVTADRDAIDRLAASTPELRVVESYDELGMVSVLASADAVAALDTDAEVARVEPDVPVSISFTRTPTASWGLDRIDQASLPLDSSYTAEPGATVVTTYVIDTGVLVGHTQFGDRLLPGYDVIGGVGTGSDCHGHGTHVAGTVAGSTYGVLPTALVVPIRVLDCNGSGWSSQIVSGINWVIADHGSGPAVINMSLGGGSSYSIDDAVARAVADGITVVVAAGNANADACNYSPARAPSAITVGSTGRSDTTDEIIERHECPVTIAFVDDRGGEIIAHTAHRGEPESDRGLEDLHPIAGRGVDRCRRHARDRPHAMGPFQRGPHPRCRQIGGAHLDPMTTSIGHQRVWRVEAHRLGVEQTGTERCREVPLEVGARIDEVGERHRVALGESEVGERGELVEDRLGHLAGDATFGHAREEPFAESLHAFGTALGTHGLTQLVGLTGREPGHIDRHLHQLFLEQRHTEGLGQ